MSERLPSRMYLRIHGQITQILIHPGVIEGTMDLEVCGKMLTVEKSICFKDLISDLEGFIPPVSSHNMPHLSI